MNKQQLETSWRTQLEDEFNQEYMRSLSDFLTSETAQGKIIYPEQNQIFAAFDHTPFDKVKVVILGQDPYHGPGQAHGLSFSVKNDVRIPPSLRNIYKEIQRDLEIPPPPHGCLEHWANQGVLLLNTVLTVEQGKAASHQKMGWEHFTDAAINALSKHRKNIVYLLWGSHAIKKTDRLNSQENLVLSSVHPSPLSAHRGFIGNGHFSATNDYLINTGQTPINWAIPDHQGSLF